MLVVAFMLGLHHEYLISEFESGHEEEEKASNPGSLCAGS